MRYLAAFLVFLMFALTGCATLGIGQSDTATRILADLGCLTALAAAGIQVAGDPMVGGAATATDVLAAIVHVGTSALPGTVMSACSQTLTYVAEDAKGALSLVRSSAGQPPATTAARKARAAALVPKQAGPVPIKVEIPLH
jgi:hypothetical protein